MLSPIHTPFLFKSSAQPAFMLPAQLKLGSLSEEQKDKLKSKIMDSIHKMRKRHVYLNDLRDEIRHQGLYSDSIASVLGKAELDLDTANGNLVKAFDDLNKPELSEEQISEVRRLLETSMNEVDKFLYALPTYDQGYFVPIQPQVTRSGEKFNVMNAQGYKELTGLRDNLKKLYSSYIQTIASLKYGA